MSTLNVMLFDVDGVLVEPRAYRIAITRTLEVLLGVDSEMLPDESEIAYFEAHGVHDVWDIANIACAQLLDASHGIRPQYRDFVDRIAALEAHAPGGQHRHPPLIALELLGGDFPFLHGTRSVYESHVTKLFQNILLGAEIFSQTYDLPSEFDGPSLLRAEDRPLLSAGSVEQLKSLRGESDCKISVYTARPSHPPSCAMGSTTGYSPEAEVALEIVGMTDFPLVGMGTMEWVAGWYNQKSEDLVKPNTTQAYTALLCALQGALDNDLLGQAYSLGNSRGNPDNTLLAPFKQTTLNVTVFEDTVSGIRPMQRAVERLSESGYRIGLTCLGIAKDRSKREALGSFCKSVFEDTNDAVSAALASRKVHS